MSAFVIKEVSLRNRDPSGHETEICNEVFISFLLQPGEVNKAAEQDSPPIKLLSSRMTIIHPLTGCR